MGRVAVLLYEFFATRKWTYLLSIAISIAIGVIIFYNIDTLKKPNFASETRSDILNVIGILLGFSISVLAIFIASGNKNIDASKEHSIGVKLWKNKTHSLFDRIVIDLSYVIFWESVVLLICFIIPAFIIDPCRELRLTCIIIAVLVHIIFVILGITSDLYLIVSKKESKNKQ